MGNPIVSPKKLFAAVSAALLTLAGGADAASGRNDKVYQAAEANRAVALDLLKEFPIAGVVINRADATSSSYGYGYEYSEQLDAT